MSAPFLGNETEISGREKTTDCNKKTKSPIQKPTSTDSPSHWTTCVSTETSRCMSVFRSRFIRVRMDNRHSIDYMRVCEQRNAAYVRNE